MGAVVDAGRSRLYLANPGNNRIQVFTTDGVDVSHFGPLGGGNGELRHPTDVIFDPPTDPRTVETGNNGTIVIGAVADPPARVLFFPLMGRSG